ncbi:hypothetical protein [Hymenobacter sp. BT559]|uniref:hypothetical protein n=1 Tax=Hymenobacter sp. BT559 TaxID=2795729 RepID=UPI0018EB54E9|nr:hypothetical protein [Hymenobacter sp. BT559]MBJ6145894.1 hypothetical protein [Hymenobacter sp. BT559]
MKKLMTIGGLVGLGGLAASPAWAQAVAQPVPPPQPVLTVVPAAAPSDEQSYQRETVFGVNFNTQGGLIGGVNVRSARTMTNNTLWFWSLEGVFFKNPKEESVISDFGGTFTAYKTNYAFALRPSVGIQRILFHKAAEAGVQVNGLLSAGPSIGLLMPYYISYDYTYAQTGRPSANDVIVNEQYDPGKHTAPQAIVDRAPFFAGISKTQVVPGVHIRGGLSFEYGRYRDAVAGAEVGFLLEAYTKRLVTLDSSTPAAPVSPDVLNKQFFPSVYLTLYLGHRS